MAVSRAYLGTRASWKVVNEVLDEARCSLGGTGDGVVAAEGEDWLAEDYDASSAGFCASVSSVASLAHVDKVVGDEFVEEAGLHRCFAHAGAEVSSHDNG